MITLNPNNTIYEVWLKNDKYFCIKEKSLADL